MHTVGDKHWQELPARLCRPRMAAGLALHRGRLWLAGGLSEASAGLVVISDVDCFDPRTHEFSFHVSFLPSPRCFFSLTVVGDRLFALGGCSANGTELQSLAEVWACQEQSWDKRGPLPRPCHDAAAVAVGRSVFLVGGLTSSTKSGLRSVCRYRATANAAQPGLTFLETPICGTTLLALPPLASAQVDENMNLVHARPADSEAMRGVSAESRACGAPATRDTSITRSRLVRHAAGSLASAPSKQPSSHFVQHVSGSPAIVPSNRAAAVRAQDSRQCALVVNPKK
ncbi:hypothetical protein HPB47_024632 [Ixodes persulcatus]|uniref:Uncharacterized protein n=1 Tax=Ixodes persulcatus TaxID=34615 RepID=A0AC60Q3R2_IXOPE|nr:hypothetical protein HPB47_024632 [Ixodes persulcatus]